MSILELDNSTRAQKWVLRTGSWINAVLDGGKTFNGIQFEISNSTPQPLVAVFIGYYL